MKKLLTIVPTRSRNEKHKELTELFLKTSKVSDLLFGLDEDDQHTYDRLNGVMYDVNPRLRMNGTLNLLANKYCNEYEYICFIGDDHRPRTEGWDEKLLASIKGKPYGMAYGNDLLKGKKLPTAILMDSNIIKKIGFMAPPILIHLYLDNFWKDFGNALGTLTYSDDVVLEHLHYSRGKSDIDEVYLEANSSAVKSADQENYEKYKVEQFQIDLEKCK